MLHSHTNFVLCSLPAGSRHHPAWSSRLSFTTSSCLVPTSWTSAHDSSSPQRDRVLQHRAWNFADRASHFCWCSISEVEIGAVRCHLARDPPEHCSTLLDYWKQWTDVQTYPSNCGCAHHCCQLQAMTASTYDYCWCQPTWVNCDWPRQLATRIENYYCFNFQTCAASFEAATRSAPSWACCDPAPAAGLIDNS